MSGPDNIRAERGTSNLSTKLAQDTFTRPRVIMVDPDTYQAVVNRLNQPSVPNAALRKTMRVLGPWLTDRSVHQDTPE
jgi:uncharacterized protein (DUF1778 family)